MKRRNIIAISVLGGIILVLAFFQTPLMATARSLTWDAWTQTIGRFFRIGILHPPTTVYDQVQQLTSDNAHLTAELGDYNRIRRQLGTPTVSDMRAIPAAVVSRPIDTWHTRYVINKGISDGVVLGAPVVIDTSTLVGFVREIHDRSAVIELLLSPTTNLTAETVVSDEEAVPARGLLTSRQYTSLYLTTIPRDIPITIGQSVVTTTKDEGLPYGLLIGKVVEVINQENEAYQEARLEFSYDVDRLDAVNILVAP